MDQPSSSKWVSISGIRYSLRMSSAVRSRGAKKEAKPGIYNLGSGQTTSFNDIVDAINEALGLHITPEYFDMPEEMIATYQHYTCADMSQTKSGLGWSPAWSPIDAMIRYARQIAAERSGSTVQS